MTTKIPISFNDNDMERVRELIELMGIVGVYGDFPKAVKFSINLTLSAIKNPEKVYNSLEESEMAVYFQSVQRAETKYRLLQKAKKLQDDAKKV